MFPFCKFTLIDSSYNARLSLRDKGPSVPKGAPRRYIDGVVRLCLPAGVPQRWTNRRVSYIRNSAPRVEGNHGDGAVRFHLASCLQIKGTGAATCAIDPAALTLILEPANECRELRIVSKSLPDAVDAGESIWVFVKAATDDGRPLNQAVGEGKGCG